MLVFWLSAGICKMALFITVITRDSIGITISTLFLLFRDVNGVVASDQVVILFLFFLKSLLLVPGSFLFFLYCFESSAALVRTAFVSLALGFLGWEKSLAVVICVYTFKVVLLEGRWPLGQQISNFWIIVLDFRPALASALTVFCIISSKFIDSRSCCSISTLIEGLKLWQK